MWRKLAATGLCATALALPVRAEVNVVNMSKQFGLPYLPMMVIEAQQLIEKNAKAMGLGDVKTTWTQRAGPATELDALLAGQADFIGPGVPTLATTCCTLPGRAMASITERNVDCADSTLSTNPAGSSAIVVIVHPSPRTMV